MASSVGDAQLSQLSDIIAARFGLHFPHERWRDLERGLSSAARELGLHNAQECARALLSTGAGCEELGVLAQHITVGETYFFREKGAFDALETRILPDSLREPGDAGTPVRIWSAGCASGEEPYSIAMAVDRSITVRAATEVEILASDVNPGFLRAASAGIYGEWSFRGTPQWIRERYFRPRSGRRWELRPEIRERVMFSAVNLVEDLDAFLNAAGALDVIFCRNVLMYFSPESMRKVLRTFHRALRPGGWLIAGVTEAACAAFAPFQPVVFPGVTIYRKIPVPVEPPIAEEGEDVAIDMRPGAPAARTRARTVRSVSATTDTLRSDGRLGRPKKTPAPRAVAPRDAAAHAANARRCADEGRLADAAQWCRRAIAAEKMNPAHHYLLSNIEREARRTESAIRSLRRALYLDPDFIVGHFDLASLEWARDRHSVAERHLRTALELLHRSAPDDVVPHADGLTARRLEAIIRSLLRERGESV